jgi:hypothetical protein
VSARRILVLVLVAFLAAPCAFAQTREATIGLPLVFEEVVIPGTELEGLPLDPKAPFHARIVAVRPHGSALRYDIECVALEPGEFDAARSLRRKDGSSLEGIPALAFVARSNLDAGLVRPHTPGPSRVPSVGGYTTWLIVAGCVWVLGLVWFIATARRKRRASAERAAARPLSLAERLRVLVERARDQELPDFERTQLEMSLVAYWRRRLGHDARPASEVLPLLRAHPEAGPLRTGLERWLHAPPGPDEVDVAALLAPYRDLPEDALELPAPR